MKTKTLIFATAILLSGCVTMPGTYKVYAVEENGMPVKMEFVAHGRHIYSVRNGFCTKFPKATVYIRSFETEKDLDGESPYQCK